MGNAKQHSVIVALGLPFVLSACDQAASPSAADIAQARAAAKELASSLGEQLTAALEAGDPASAISVCQYAAPAVAAGVSEHTGVRIGRTSLRVRNPENAPDEWERARLREFEDAQAGGAELAMVERSEMVLEGDQIVFRWMKPIPLGHMCLQCHGPAIDADVAAAIDARYPDDQATGFSIGEVRGAFTVTKVVGYDD